MAEKNADIRLFVVKLKEDMSPLTTHAASIIEHLLQQLEAEHREARHQKLRAEIYSTNSRILHEKLDKANAIIEELNNERLSTNSGQTSPRQ